MLLNRDTPAWSAGLRGLLRALKQWCLGWGVLYGVALFAVPSSFRLGPEWVPLHSVLEILTIAIVGMIFVVARNVLILSGAAAGLYAGACFLLVAVLDTAHLLSFPGMPDWLTVNQHAKSITFWLLARLTTAFALLLTVSVDWQRRGSSGTSRFLSLAAVVVAAGILVPGGAWFAEHHPRVFWVDSGITAPKLALEYLVIAVLVIALGVELRRSGRSAPYRKSGMLQVLLTLMASEWCFTAYEQADDVRNVLGHLYKLIGFFLLYRSLVYGLIRIPFRQLTLTEARASRKGRELEAIFSASPDGLLLVGDSGRILKANLRCEEMLGYPPGQLLGQPIEALLPERFRELHRKHVEGYLRGEDFGALRGNRELFALRCDGSELPVDIALNQLEIDGRHCVVAAIRDISERVGMLRRVSESEHRVRSFLDNSVDWVWESDPSGCLTYSSQRVRDLLGYAPEAVVGRNLGQLMSDTDALKLGPQIREIVLRREPLLRLDHSMLTADGELRLMETNARPFFEPDGRFMGYRGVTRDVTSQRDLQRALEKSERIFRNAFDDFPTGMAFVSCNGRVLRVNAYLSQLLGYPAGELETLDLSSLLLLEQRWEISQEILALCEGRRSLFAAELRLLGKDGRPRWTRLAAALVDRDNADGKIGPLLLMISDISAEKTAASNSLRLQKIVERMGDAVVVADRSGGVLYMNPFAKKLLGLAPDESLAGQSIRRFHPDPVGDFIVDKAFALAESSGHWEGEVVWQHRAGEQILTWQVMMVHRDATGDFEYWTVVARDIRERKQLEERLSHQATHDALTGLPNRLLMRDRLQQAINTARREHKLLAVLFVDLDNFKRINDTLGHAYGDVVLIEVAALFREVLRASDTLARQGGDEFIVLLPGLNTLNDVIAVLDKMMKSLSQSFVIDGREIYVTASVGVSIFPFDHDNGDELLRKADVAMYQAKEQGRNNYLFYTADMDERFKQDLQMEIELRHAIDNGELCLHYQPKVELSSERLLGYEALVRWMHPQRGMIPPGEFIPLAERSMLIAHLGEWVIREACRQIGEWRDQGLAVLPVAVNVSGQQFEYMDVPRLLENALDDCGLDGGLLELEITEGVLMRDPQATTRALNQIKGLGVNIAVDDFGTGYSSLGYLKQFPVDVLKIDRSFIAELPGEPDDGAIIRAIVSMAHNLEISVVAEGVETREQFAYLRECGCDFVQGFLFGRPMPAAQVAREMNLAAADLTS